MPRKKRTIIEESLPDDPNSEGLESGPSELDISLEDVEAEKLSEILSEHGVTDQKFRIYRGDEFVYECDKLDERFIQKHFGGGDYRVRIFLHGRYKTSIPLRIAKPLIPLGDDSSPEQNHSFDHHSAFLEKLLLTLLANNQNQKQTPVSELTTALIQLEQLRGTKDTNLDTFLKAIDLVKSLDSGGNGGDWKSDLFHTIRTVAPGILQNMPALQQSGAPNQSQQIAMTPEQQGQQILKGYIQQLKSHAIQNVDTGLVVDWIVNNLHDEKFQYVYRTVLSTPFDQFATIDPEIGKEPYVQWFKSLYDGLRSANQQPDQVDEDFPIDSGNMGDTPSNGRDRPRR